MRRRFLHRMSAVAIAACVSAGAIAPTAQAVVASEVSTPKESSPEWAHIQELIGAITGKWTGDAYGGAYSNSLPNTALLGNGDLGVTSAGAGGEKTFLVSKSDFVSAGDLKGVFNSGDNLTKPLPIGGVTLKAREDTKAINLAPGASEVTASSSHDDFQPRTAVSGNMQPSPNGYGWVTAIGKEHWLELSFPKPITVQRWVVKNDGAVRSGYSMNNTSDFRLQVGETGGSGATWTDVSVVEGNTKDVFDENLDAPVTGAHFRLLVTEPLQRTNTDPNPRARIGQFELYETTKDAGEAVTTKETQNILDARIETTMALGGVPVSMRTWLAPDHNIMVSEVTSQGSKPVDLKVTTWGKSGNAHYPVTSGVEQGIATASRATFNNAPKNPLSWRSKATLATTVVGADTKVTADPAKGESYTGFTLEPATAVQIVTTVGGGGKTYDAGGALPGEDPDAEALALLADASEPAQLDKLRREQAQWWKNFWSASYIDLPNRPEVMRYYYGAQYLLGSTSRAGNLAPGLYGLWHTTDNPNWSSDYHLNYNFIATFYGTNSSNRPKLSLPAVDAMLDFLPNGEARAADPAQLRRINSAFIDSRPDLQDGIRDAVLFPVGIGPWGTVTDDTYHAEALNAPYSAYPLIQYFHYTQDKKFLSEKVYDYLVRCVNFYDAWLQKSGDLYTLYAGYNEGSWATNPAVELAALKKVLRELIDASVLLGRDKDRRAHWQDLYDHLAPQPTSTWNGKEVYSLAEKEWKGGQWVPLANPVPGDGNIIPLDIVVPGGQLGYYSSAKEQQIARNTIDVFGSGAWRQINNFPRIFNDAVLTRYPAKVVLDNLTETINTQIQPNLRISDGVHGVEKIGATAAINNMLLTSDRGVVKVFPNWVAGEDASFARLRAEGAFVVSAAYDGSAGRVGDVTVTSEAGQRMTISSPWPEGTDVFDSTGAQVGTAAGTAPNWDTDATVSFDTLRGQTYKLRPHKPTYAIKVDQGSASPSKARAGDVVTITADAAPDYYVFDTWEAGGVEVANPYAATTTFVMPDHDVSIAATYQATVPVLDATVTRNGHFTMINFPIRDASGTEYTLYVSKSGKPATFEPLATTRFDAKGARFPDMTHDAYVYVVHRVGGKAVEVTTTVKITP